MPPASKPPASHFETQRRVLYKGLIEDDVISCDAQGVVSFADKDSRLSREIAKGIYDLIDTESRTVAKGAGQTLGAGFEEHVRLFLMHTFMGLGHLRPGRWHVEGATSAGIARFEQYEHLDHLQKTARNDAALAAALGTDYIVKPDVLVYRDPEPDTVINEHRHLVDDTVARGTVLRAINHTHPNKTPHLILHASVSTKVTLRSDRAQNARTEALNLLRNRKGRVPHMVVVTAEPMPSRLASLALGTGDIDCVYHLFLPELQKAIDSILSDSGGVRGEDARDLLRVMVSGRRLKDIADLPLDLAV